jgi:hypothetical protein
MWFRTKPVVHVDVRENDPPAPGHPEPYVGSYRFIGDPSGQYRTYYFEEPKSFRYSNEITAHVKGDLPANFSEKEKKRTLVKIWRDDATRNSSKAEKSVVSALNLGLFVEIAFVVAIAVWGALLSQEEAEQLFPGTALAAIAANAAFFFGNFAMRGSKLGEPFEYTKRQQLFTYGAVVTSLLVNIAVLNGFPASLLPPTLIELGDTIQRILAIVGLIGTVIGAGFSGAFDAFKWAIIEEAQRKHVAARGAMDVVERRVRV